MLSGERSPLAKRRRCRCSVARHNVRVYPLHPAHRGRRERSQRIIVSQVFLEVWRNAGQFEGRSQVSTWMLAIARFKALTALRNRRHEDTRRSEEVLQIADTADDAGKPGLDRSQTVVERCAGACHSCRRPIARSSTSSTTTRTRWKRSAISSASRRHREDPHVLRPQAPRRTAEGSRFRTQGGLRIFVGALESGCRRNHFTAAIAIRN